MMLKLPKEGRDSSNQKGSTVQTILPPAYNKERRVYTKNNRSTKLRELGAIISSLDQTDLSYEQVMRLIHETRSAIIETWTKRQREKDK